MFAPVQTTQHMTPKQQKPCNTCMHGARDEMRSNTTYIGELNKEDPHDNETGTQAVVLVVNTSNPWSDTRDVVRVDTIDAHELPLSTPPWTTSPPKPYLVEVGNGGLRVTRQAACAVLLLMTATGHGKTLNATQNAIFWLWMWRGAC